MVDRVDVGSIRRVQIVEAATRVIARQGIQNASLSEIEGEAGVSRGVLTYHFRSKEDLMLAVFDATLDKLRGNFPPPGSGPSGLALVESIFDFLMTQKPRDDVFDSLHYTFLAQMSHRADYRARLSAQHADTRAQVARDLSEDIDHGDLGPCDVEAVSAVVIGLMHGLNMQRIVDPAFDGRRALGVLKTMLREYLGTPDRDRRRDAVPEHETTETAG